MTEREKPTGLALLREPFPPNQISKRPQPLQKDSPKGRCPECGGWHGLPAIHLDYVGHAALTDRLLDVDPQWNWEPLAYGEDGLPRLDSNGGLWIKLTLCGHTRLGYGDAEGRKGPDAIKELIGDALRNAAMRFGAALDLWHKGELRARHLTDEQMIEARGAIRSAVSLEELYKAGAGAGEFADEEQRLELKAIFTERKHELLGKQHGTVDESDNRRGTDAGPTHRPRQIRNRLARNTEQQEGTPASDPASDGRSESGPSGTGRGGHPPTTSGDGLP